MATLNPLEQKARSSFIRGFIIALLVGLLAAGGMGYLYYQKISEEQERISKQKNVVVLKTNLKSGEKITSEMVQQIKADANVVPEGSVQSFDQLMQFFGGEEGQIDPEKSSIIAKVDLPANSIIGTSVVSLETEPTTNDVRIEQYNMIVLPIDLKSKETVDIRLRLPSGQDYIVLSKKRIVIPDIDGEPLSGVIQMNVSESEILTINAAIVDAYKIKGSKLYAIKYAEPGMQEKASETYIPAADTLRLIVDDPNIIEKAKAELVNFYNNNNEKYRTSIANELSNVDSETQKSSVESKTSSEVSTQKSDREKFLQSAQ